jgi:hypothetical protein
MVFAVYMRNVRGQDNRDYRIWRIAAVSGRNARSSGEFFRKDSRLLSRTSAFVVLIERSDEEIKPMAPFAFIDRRKSDRGTVDVAVIAGAALGGVAEGLGLGVAAGRAT